ncbi:MAG TPA: nitrilase-related carbon-nitrogen hydrolase [Streptosporangiaceae bacterium]|jgi:predicted amidohydrolase
MSDTLVACCQLAPALGEAAANRELAADAVARAAGQGASVIVLPELVTSGYVFRSRDEARACAEPADGPAVAAWSRLAAEHDVVIVGGFCELAGDELYNSAAMVDRSGVRTVYRKVHLWDQERYWFTPGSAAPEVIATRFGKLAVVICYDLEFPEWVRLPSLDGAQLLCAPVNWPAFPRPDGERPSEIFRVQAGAAVNRMFIAVADRAGQERGVEWVSGSVIVDADGWPLAGAALTAGPVTISAPCRLDDALDKAVSATNDVHADRRPELYRRVAEPAG